MNNESCVRLQCWCWRKEKVGRGICRGWWKHGRSEVSKGCSDCRQWWLIPAGFGQGSLDCFFLFLNVLGTKWNREIVRQVFLREQTQMQAIRKKIGGEEGIRMFMWGTATSGRIPRIVTRQTRLAAKGQRTVLLILTSTESLLYDRACARYFTCIKVI